MLLKSRVREYEPDPDGRIAMSLLTLVKEDGCTVASLLTLVKEDRRTVWWLWSLRLVKEGVSEGGTKLGSAAVLRGLVGCSTIGGRPEPEESPASRLH